jgi:hypothetical protein
MKDADIRITILILDSGCKGGGEMVAPFEEDNDYFRIADIQLASG